MLPSSSMRLWQLISPTLPIGTYAYSQAQEYAVEIGWVHDQLSAQQWITGQIEHNLASLDVPVFIRLYKAWKTNDIEQVQYWNDMILALRESSELRMEDGNLGAALNKVLTGLDISLPATELEEVAFVTVYSFACVHWDININEAMQGLLWAWCENQVAAAIKLVPLGQTAGQIIMSNAIESISMAVNKAETIEDEDIGLLAPGLAIASALHETQYTRLFRS